MTWKMGALVSLVSLSSVVTLQGKEKVAGIVLPKQFMLNQNQYGIVLPKQFMLNQNQYGIVLPKQFVLNTN